LHGLLKGWDEDTQPIIASAVKDDPILIQKLQSLDKELAEAKRSNNPDVIRDLSEKRLGIEEAMTGWTPEIQQQLADVDAKYRSAIRELVSPEKADRLDDILDAAQDAQPNRPRRGPTRSPRALKAIVDRLGDLTPQQHKSIDDAFLHFRDAQRANPKAAQGKDSETSKLYDAVFAVLTSGQKARVEQELAVRTGALPADPKSPATPGDKAPAGPIESIKPATGSTPPAKAAGEKP